MGFIRFATLLALASPAIQCSTMASWTNEELDITYRLAIPEVEKAPFPMKMSIIAPKSVTWAGFATGGCMLRSPLLVAWPNGDDVMVSARWATQYHPPAFYDNTTIEVFPSTTVNDTHWQVDFVCSEGCSDWYGGEIDPNWNNATLGYAASNRPIETPDDPATSIPFHTLEYSHFDLDLNTAKHPEEEFEMLLKASRRVRRS